MIEARAADLLAKARANPAITITDEAKAADYFRSRAIADAARKELPFCAYATNGIPRLLKHQ